MDRFAIFENSCTYQVEMCDEAGLPVDFVSRDLGYSTQPLFWYSVSAESADAKSAFFFLCTVP